MRKLLKLFLCWMGGHDWTTPFLERKCELDQEQVRIFGYKRSFDMDNEMFCKRCGCKSKLH